MKKIVEFLDAFSRNPLEGEMVVFVIAGPYDFVVYEMSPEEVLDQQKIVDLIKQIAADKTKEKPSRIVVRVGGNSGMWEQAHYIGLEESVESAIATTITRAQKDAVLYANNTDAQEVVLDILKKSNPSG
jgi:hypothetical protein